MKKRVLIVYDFLSEFGGLERVMFAQANALAQRHDVTLAFNYVDDEVCRVVAQVYDLDATVRIAQIGSVPNSCFQYMASLMHPARIGNARADLVIAHSFLAARHAEALFRRYRTPYLVMMYHPPNFLYNRSAKWANNAYRRAAYLLGGVLGPVIRSLDRRAVRGARLVCAISRYTAQRVKAIYGIDAEILYPGISEGITAMPGDDSRLHLTGMGLSGRFVLMHGRIVADKRPDWAVEAFARLAKQHPDLLCVISGTVEGEAKIGSLAKRLCVGDRVRCLGRVTSEQLRALYSTATCLLMPAPREDFGLTPVEAMACGCPAIGWNDGAGPSETIQPGVNGLLAEPYSLDSFADCIREAMESKWNPGRLIQSVNLYREKKVASQFLSYVDMLFG